MSEHIDFYLFAIVPIIAVIGTIVTSFILNYVGTNKKKNNKVWDLYSKFNSKEFQSARNIVWVELYKKWDETMKPNGMSKNIILNFLGDDIPSKSNLSEKEYVKFIEVLYSVDVLLEFLVELHINFRDDQINKKLAMEMLLNKFSWWRDFFIKFMTEYLKEMEDQNSARKYHHEEYILDPLWISTVKWLEQDFKPIQ